MIRPLSSASDPGCTTTPRTIGSSDADISRAPRKKTPLILLLGPDPCQQFEMSDDSSEDDDPDGGDSDADDEKSSGRGAQYNPPPSPSPPGRTHRTTIRSVGREESSSRLDHSPQRTLHYTDRYTYQAGESSRHGNDVEGRPRSSRSERGGFSGPARETRIPRRLSVSNDVPRIHHPSSRRGMTCAYPILASPESSLLWSQTQPSMDVDILITDDEDAGEGDEDSHVERMIQRDRILDELLAESPPPAYATAVLPRHSIRPQLPTIQSGHTLADPAIYRSPALRGVQGTFTPINHHSPVLSHQSWSGQPRSGTSSSSDDPGQCDACGRKSNGEGKMKMVPCDHIVCSNCYGSAISAVSAKRDLSKCTSCLKPVTSFKVVSHFSPTSTNVDVSSGESTGSGMSPDGRSDPSRTTRDTSIDSSPRVSQEPIVLRIDNVAWDITPAVVRQFLPADSISKTSPSPIHVLLDRRDGRTRDYLYVELASSAAARQILQTRQNALMPCGPLSGDRRRAVTVSLVSHDELLEELRPHSPAELNSLLVLCQAAMTIPYISSPPPGFPARTHAHDLPCGVQGAHQPFPAHIRQHAVPISSAAHFVKNRHGPFYALMSILSKLTGRASPAYWDIYSVASGAIAALASAIDRCGYHADSINVPGLAEDRRLLDALRDLHAKRFVLTPASSPE